MGNPPWYYSLCIIGDQEQVDNQLQTVTHEDYNFFDPQDSDTEQLTSRAVSVAKLF